MACRLFRSGRGLAQFSPGLGHRAVNFHT